MNTTKQSFVWASLLLAGVVLGCRPAARDAERNIARDIERNVGKEAGRQTVKALDKATKDRVLNELRRAAREDGRDAAKKRFDELQNQEPTFGEYLKQFGEAARDQVRDCVIGQLLIPEQINENITKRCL